MAGAADGKPFGKTLHDTQDPEPLKFNKIHSSASFLSCHIYNNPKNYFTTFSICQSIGRQPVRPLKGIGLY